MNFQYILSWWSLQCLELALASKFRTRSKHKLTCQGRRNRENDNVYISFILKPCDLKFGMHVVKTLLYFMKPADYTNCTYFFDIFLGVWSEWAVFYVGQSSTPFFIYGSI